MAQQQLQINLDTPSLRKARGAFFTPPELSEFMVRWAVRTHTDAVLEPSCGEAAFLLPSAFRLRELGARKLRLHGVDLHGPSAQRAAILLRSHGFDADIRVADFFTVSGGPDYDAVVGNPPYVRYQDFAGTARERGLQAAASQGVKLDGLANIWAAFVVHAATCLKPDGRLAMVLPATLLTANYAAPIRSYLLRRFSRVGLVMFRERVFPGVQEEVVLLLAEGTGAAGAIHVTEVADASSLASLDFWQQAHPTPAAGAKWTTALLEPHEREAYSSVVRSAHFETLGDWGRVDLGMVTGNNKYFTMTPAEASERGLQTSELLNVCPAGARHLPGTTFSKAAWNELGHQAKRTLLFYPDPANLSDAARRYIAEGEASGVHRAYKCRMRNPWWRVPTVSPPHLFFTYMSGVAPRLVTNRASARHLNSLLGVTLHRGRVGVGQSWLPLASLNSVSLLGAELIGRSYGGGVLKIEPREAVLLPVPTRDVLNQHRDALRVVRDRVMTQLRMGNIAEVSRIVDDVLLARALRVDRTALRSVRSALSLLRERRRQRGRA